MSAQSPLLPSSSDTKCHLRIVDSAFDGSTRDSESPMAVEAWSRHSDWNGNSLEGDTLELRQAFGNSVSVLKTPIHLDVKYRALANRLLAEGRLHGKFPSNPKYYNPGVTVKVKMAISPRPGYIARILHWTWSNFRCNIPLSCRNGKFRSSETIRIQLSSASHIRSTVAPKIQAARHSLNSPRDGRS